ncbi:hypothetical protein ACH5RR_032281, partial [Cinchona calisaya]
FGESTGVFVRGKSSQKQRWHLSLRRACEKPANKKTFAEKQEKGRAAAMDEKRGATSPRARSFDKCWISIKIINFDMGCWWPCGAVHSALTGSDSPVEGDDMALLPFCNNAKSSRNFFKSYTIYREFIYNVMGATGEVPKQFNQQNVDGQNLETFQVNKRCKKSEAWNDFKDVVDGVKKVERIHCKSKLAKNATGTTSSMIRHRQTCVIRKMSLRQAVQQTKINFQPTDAPVLPVPPLHFGKFDMEKMREAAAHWAVEFCFPQLFPSNEAQENISKVRTALFELYDEYVAANDHDQLGKRKISQVGDSSMDAIFLPLFLDGMILMIF